MSIAAAGRQPALEIPGVWRGRVTAAIPTRPTGHAPLDRILPGGGWPLGALSELLVATPEQGLSLALPLLAAASAQNQGAALVNPPLIPYAPGLEQAGVRTRQLLWITPRNSEDGLWAAEQLLRSPAIGAVLYWPGRISDHQLRRLQLAAEAGACIGILFRAAREAQQSSPAALRLTLNPRREALQVQVHKCRGGMPGATAQIGLQHTTR